MTILGRIRSPRKYTVIFGPASMAFALAASINLAARASDFSHAQHIYVPPTSIPRHFDSDALNYGDAAGDSAAIASNGVSNASATSGSSTNTGASTQSKTRHGRIINKTVYCPPGGQSRQASSSGVANDVTPAMNAFVTQARTKARALVREGKLKAAEKMLQTDLKAVPRSQGLRSELASVRLARAKYSMKINNANAALTFTEAALIAQPNNIEAKQLLAQLNAKNNATTCSINEHLEKAKVLMAQAQYVEANNEIVSAMGIQENADEHVALGDLSAHQGNQELAQSEYNKALDLNPQCGGAFRQMGMLKLNQNNLAGASQALSRALIIDSRDKDAALSLQNIWHGQVAKSPQSANAHLGLARAYQLSDDLIAAQAEYKTVAKLDPQHQALPAARQSFKLALAKKESIKCLQAAQTLENAGALREAHQKALEAVNISPSCVSARLFLGSICEKLALYGEAEDTYMTVLKYDPQNKIAAHHLRMLESTGSTTASGVAPIPPSASTYQPPAGMYVFKGWDYGHPLANNTPSSSPSSFASSSPSSFASAPQNPASYPYSGNPSQQGANSSYAQYAGQPQPNNQLTALSAGPTLSLPAQLPALPPGQMDPASPMPLQGTPPQSAGTTAHVSAFSNFLSSLRDLNVSQKQQAQQAEQSLSPVLSPAVSVSPGNPGSLYSGSPAQAAASPVALPSQSSISSILAQAASAVANASGNATGQNANTSAGASSSTANSNQGIPGGSSLAAVNLTGATAQSSNSGSSTAPTTPNNTNQSLSSAAWQAAPAWLKQKFPNMTEQDFTAMAANLKGNLKSQLQAWTAQQKAAAQNGAQSPQATMSLAGFLPNPSNNTSQFPNLSGSTVNTAVQGDLLNTNSSVAATTDQAEIDLLAKAGQDAPTLAPPDVAPIEGMPLAQTTSKIDAPSETNPKKLNNKQGDEMKALNGSLAGATSLRPPLATLSQLAAAKEDLNNNDNSNAAIVLELEGVKPSPNGMRLKVQLKNSRTKALPLPNSAKATIHVPGFADKEAKVTFAAKEVPPGGVVQGIIKVPGGDINPASDLVLVNFLPSSFADRDVHLTVPISSLIK